MILILGKKIHFRENWLIFSGIWGEAELFLGIWGAKANSFREKRKLFSGIRGDQCIIFRDLGSTYPPPLGGPHNYTQVGWSNAKCVYIYIFSFFAYTIIYICAV